MNGFPALLGAGLTVLSGISIVASPQLTVGKKLIMLATRALGIAGMFRSPQPLLNHQGGQVVVNSADTLLFASAIMGYAFEPRREQDYRKLWRAHVSGAIGDYALPMGGVRNMIVSVVENAPLYVDPKYHEEWEKIVSAYRHSSNHTSAKILKDDLRERAYESALNVFNNVGFWGGVGACRQYGGKAVSVQAFRMTLSKNLFYTGRVEGREVNSLVTPALFGMYPVAEVPEMAAYVSVNRGMFEWRPLRRVFSEAPKNSVIDIALAIKPLTGPESYSHTHV